MLIIDLGHPLLERLTRNSTMEPDGCWTWRGDSTAKGYGRLELWTGGSRRRVRLHRYTYELAFGPIPPELQIDHLCRNRRCWRPSHLEAVTSRTNSLRGMSPSGVNSRKTHCPRGHEYTEANTTVWDGHRKCRACLNERRRRRYRARHPQPRPPGRPRRP